MTFCRRNWVSIGTTMIVARYNRYRQNHGGGLQQMDGQEDTVLVPNM
jgi:hypothetical protein